MAIFDFSDFNKDDEDEDKLTPSQKAAKKVEQTTQKKKESGTVFDFNDFETTQKTVVEEKKPEPVEQKPKEDKNILERTKQKVSDVVKGSEEDDRNILEKTRDFLKSTKEKVFSQESKQKVEDAIKGIGERAKTYYEQEEEKLRLADTDKSGRLSFEEIQELSTVPFLQKEKINVEQKIAELEQKPEKSKLDQVRIKNLNDKFKEIDKLLGGTPEDRRKAQGKITGYAAQRFSSDVAAGVLDTTATLPKVVTWQAESKGDVGTAAVSRGVSSKLEEWANAVRPENPEFGDQIAEGLGSAVSFYVPGLGVAKGTQMLTKVSPGLALIFGQSAMAALESASEAGSVYEDLRAEGKTVRQADHAAKNTFWANVALNTVLERFGFLSEGKRMRVLKTSTSEGVQELSQQVISNVNSGRPYYEGTIESGAVGAVIGGGLGGAVDVDAVMESENIVESDLMEKISEKKLEEPEVKKVEEVGEIKKPVEEMTDKEFVDDQEKQAKKQDQEVIDKAKSDIERAKELIKEAPEKSEDLGVKTKAYYQRYIEDTQKFIDKKVEKDQKGVKQAEKVLKEVPKGLEPLFSQVKKFKNYEDFEVSMVFPKKGKESIAQKIAVESLGFTSDNTKPLKDFYDKYSGGVVEKPKVKPKKVEVPREQLPVSSEGKKKVSKLEARIQKQLKSVPKETIDRLGLSTYEQVNKKENIAKATEYALSNPKEALQVLRGDKEAPKGILRNSIFVAMQNQAIGDVDLARKLASLQSTRYGQELSVLTEIDPDSPVNIIKKVIQVREEAYSNKKKKSVNKSINKEVKKINDKVKTPNKNDWGNFINSIKC